MGVSDKNEYDESRGWSSCVIWGTWIVWIVAVPAKIAYRTEYFCAVLFVLLCKMSFILGLREF